MEHTADVDTMTLDQRIGQLLIAGFHGASVSPEIAELITRRHIGGVILFSRNIREPRQVMSLIASLQGLAKDAGHPAPLLIAVDQENGVVRRFGQGVTVFPGAMAIAATGSVELAYQVTLATGRELRALGVNMNLAPVLDVNNNPANPVIGVRSFGEDPREVARFGVAAIRGYRDAGVISCAKHFPGHGDTIADSHLSLPVIPHTLERLDAVELAPFKAAIESDVDSVMMGHPAFPQLMGSTLEPATISPRIVRELLRTRMGYEGVVTTDDMEMRAITNTVGTARGVALALRAGCDVALVSHHYDEQARSLDAVRAAVASGELPEERVRQSAERVLRLKALRTSWGDLRDGNPPAWVGGEEHQRLAERCYERAVTLVRDDRGLLPLSLSPQRRALVLYPARESLTGVEDNRFPEDFLAASIRRRHANTDAIAISLRPEAEEREQVAQQAAAGDVVIVAAVNANLFTEQAALVRRLLQEGREVIGIAVRNPYDLLVVPELPIYLATYEYTPGALEAAAKALFGEIAPHGRLPVSLPGLYRRGWSANEARRRIP
ncbi:MAG TPA: beta-N-acetylhexosaminidase [Ktedonobacterales bacterium]